MNRKLTAVVLVFTLLSLMLTSQRSNFAYADEQASSQLSSAFTGAQQQALVQLMSIPAELECTSSDTVLLIQDVIPWARVDLSDTDLGANVVELTVQQKPFCMIHSEDIDSTDLTQFKEIVISAAQNQAFYDNLFPSGTIHSDVEDWVDDGGILSANLADCASNEGDDPEGEPPSFVAGGVWADLEVEEICTNETADIESFTFVGGLKHVIEFDGTGFSEDNSIAAPTNPVITGAFGGANGGTIVDVDPQVDIDGWFFSAHGYFTDLPVDTTVILTRPNMTDDSIQEPVMIQYPFGSGLVIASLITAEWRYIGGFLNTADPGDPPVIIHPFDPNKKILANEIGFQDALTQPCILREEQPEDPISMNTVRNKNIAKTIHAEKQIFDCVLPQGNLPVIVDVTIIGEIFEDMDTKSIIKKQAQVITCTKDKLDGTVLGCDATTPTTNPTVPMRNCNEFLVQHPQEMNTVNKGNIVKTIESQKEVFLCNIGAGAFKKVDIVLFTEIWENLSNLSSPIIKVEFEAMRCVLNLGVAEVETCRFLNVFN